MDNIKLKPSEEKPWIKYYTEEQLNTTTPQRTLYEHLYKSNLEHLNNTAIDYYGTKITFNSLFDKIDLCSRALSNIGVKKGDVVSVCMPNLPEAVISVYAINKIGAIANMIHPLKSKNEIKSYIEKSKSKCVIALDSVANKMTDCDVILIKCSPKDSMCLPLKAAYSLQEFAKKERKAKTVTENKATVIKWKDFIKNGINTKYTTNEYHQNDTAILMHTGGTSGDEKTVALSNDNFNSMIMQFRVIVDNFSVGDKMLTIMPVFHGFGLCSSIHLPLCYGVSIILVPQFVKKDFYALMKKNPNHIIGVPTLFNAMLTDTKIQKMNLSFLKYVVSGGDSMKNEDEINRFLLEHNAEVTMQKGYGLSEAVAGVTFAFGKCNKVGSIGIPMVSMSIKIVDTITKEELDYNEVGEICISGPTVMSGGYYNNAQQTAKALIKDDNGTIWLHTGDMGYIDTDGVLFYSQRQDRMFQSSGVNVYPDSIERTIMQINDIEECVIIPRDDNYKGKIPVAIIKPKNKSFNSDSLKEQIKSICSSNLDRYHQPADIIFLEEMPTTKVGKIDYRTLEKEVVNL